MTDGESASLDFEQVVQRFADSEQALRDLGSKIESLSTLEVKSEASTEALERSAREVAEYTGEAKNVASELAETTRAARELLTRAKEVLDGSQLERIENRIADGSGKLEGIRQRQGEHLKTLQTSIDGVASAIDAASSRLLEELDQSEELGALGESVERTGSSVKELGSKLVSELQKRLRSTEETVKAADRKITWLLVGIILLQVAALGMIIFSPS